MVTAAELKTRFFRWALILAPLVLLLGMLSGYLSQSGEENPWFAALDKPALYPPPIAFPVAWTLLYAMMGTALALVIAGRPSRWRGPAILAFAVQLALNLAWSPAFFAAHEITWALVIILALDVTVIATIVLFGRVSKLAAWLLAPYLAWILFATGLNWQILQDNPLADGAESRVAVQGAAI